MALGDWMEGDNPFEIKKDVKKENADAAVIFAQKFKVFETGPAKDMLDHWTRMVRYRNTAPSASATEFAYAAGVREFVEGIRLQIEFANNGGLSPYRDR